jgi:hypothetical protein
MSFNNIANKVRNKELPISTRASALRSCALRLAKLENKKRSEILELLYSFLQVQDSNNLNEIDLIKGIEYLEKERNKILRLKNS